jgi:large repetitive protein
VSAPIPGLISGVSSGICAGTNQSYSIAAVSGADSYVWSTTGDISITDGQGTTNATLAYGPTFSTGTISVRTQNVCGLSAARTLSIKGVASSAPMSISGTAIGICASTAGVSYTAATVAGATSYVWSATGDISIASGQGTQNATFDFGPTFSTGTIRVQAVNACGTLSLVRSLSVRALPLTPSVISGNLSAIVPGSSETYSVTPGAGVTSYEWVLPANASISAGSGTNSITVDFAPAFTGGI